MTSKPIPPLTDSSGPDRPGQTDQPLAGTVLDSQRAVFAAQELRLISTLVAPLAYLGLHAIEANVITPAVLGRRFTVNPVLILFSFSYFTWIWGVIGALLSVPLLLTLLAAFEHLGKPNLVGFAFGEPLFPRLPELAAGEEAAAGGAAADPAGQAAPLSAG